MAGSEGPDTTRRVRVLLYAAALIPFILLAVVHWSDGPELHAGDQYQYLLHARALQEGRSYTDIGFIFTEFNPLVGPVAEPVGLPWTIRALRAVFGEDLFSLKVWNTAWGVVFLLLAGCYFERRAGLLAGLGVTLLAGLSPSFVHAAGQVLADLPFCAFVWIAIALLDGSQATRPRNVALIVLAGCFAILYRAAGLALIPALAVFWLVRWRERALLVVPLAAWTALYLVVSLWLPVADATVSATTQDLGSLLGNVRTNILDYRLAGFESHLYPFAWNVANDAYHVLSSLLALVGLVAWLRRRAFDYLTVFAAVYIGMLLILPGADQRYLWPLFPFCLFLLIDGLRIAIAGIGRGASARRASAVALGFAVVVAALSIVTHANDPRPTPLSSHPDARDLFARLEALDDDGEIRVVFFKPRVLSWETGIPAMPHFIASPETTIRELVDKRISHVVVGDLGLWPVRNRSVAEAVEASPKLFEVLFVNRSFEVYRFKGATAQGQVEPGNRSLPADANPRVPSPTEFSPVTR